MRALRVVGLAEGGDVVLEDPVRLERYTVPADERLRAAARGDLSRLGQIATELESQLRPREIQARIRAGASVEQVATAAGVPVQKIERFAYPVLPRALPHRGRRAARPPGARGRAGQPHPLRGRRPHLWLARPDVRRCPLGLVEGRRRQWVVALSWRAGRSDNRAHWTFQPGAHGGTVTALDEHASDLVEGLPARPLRTVGPVIDMTRQEEETPPPSPVEEWRAAASDSFRDRTPTGPDPGRPAPERGARPAPEPRRPAQRTADSPVPAEPSPGTQRDAAPRPDRSAADLASPAVPATTAHPADPAPHQPVVDDTADDEATSAAANRRTKKGKPVMPSWDEVLLGVRGPR